jgi:hypothetical protein
MFPRRGGGGVVVIVERGRLLVLVWMPPGPPACMHFLSLESTIDTSYDSLAWGSDRFPFFVSIDFHLLLLSLGPISISLDRFDVRTDFHLFGSVSIFCLDRFPFVRTDFHLFGSISICSDRFPFVRTDFQWFGPISICSDRFPFFVWTGFHLFHTQDKSVSGTSLRAILGRPFSFYVFLRRNIPRVKP